MFRPISALVIIIVCLAFPLLLGCTSTAATTSTDGPPTTATSITGSVTPSHLAEPVEIISVAGPEKPYVPAGPTVMITLRCVSDEPIVWLKATLELNQPYDFEFPASASKPFTKGDTSAHGMTLINGGFSDDIAYPLTVSGTFRDGWTFSFTKDMYITPPVE